MLFLMVLYLVKSSIGLPGRFLNNKSSPAHVFFSDYFHWELIHFTFGATAVLAALVIRLILVPRLVEAATTRLQIGFRPNYLLI